MTDSTPNTQFRIAFIQSCWHRDIVDQCRDSFLKEIAKLTESTVDCVELPGAFEIPLHAKLLAETGKYDAIVAAGLVTDSGIYRHDFVAHAVIDGLMQVQLETRKPVFSAVLTPHKFHNYDEHTNFFTEHFVVKGKEAAVACAATLESLNKLSLL
ncbi:riboflavin synthase subunit beta [marine gamma proteobacterium HTCC2143]|jgi:6,7-dimethyl-8-ribityllumazine synthase|uniref:6,7-dimethyl-8-ribityllumazine synthase n=1 Tax=marine gamma proteobacterium HTCC2143 TaxID=247633 RepID=A0Y875_9GAMM|nr:riboflavin synthase subunit beta [marine gamma proteobacterium HTCC2143]